MKIYKKKNKELKISGFQCGLRTLYPMYVLGSDASSSDDSIIKVKKLRRKHKDDLIGYLDIDIIAYCDFERPIIQTNVAKHILSDCTAHLIWK